MKLYFLRHGPAGDRASWRGSDADRPLTRDGEARMARTGAAMAALGLEPDAVLTSPLVRALRTAEVVAEALGVAGRLEVDARLGAGFSMEELGAIVRERSKLESLLLVGHEPGLGSVISALTGGGRLVLKKGGLACVNLTGMSPPCGELLWLVPPRILAPDSE